MNKKGFTLVELLFVVVLMAIIAMITMPNIFEMLDSSKTKKYEEYEKILVENLKLYNIDKKEELWVNGAASISISGTDLLQFNPDINIDGCQINELNIIRTNNNYQYSVCLACQYDKNDATKIIYYPTNCNE